MKTITVTVKTFEDLVPLFDGVPLDAWLRWIRLSPDRQKLPPLAPPPVQQDLWAD